MRVCDACRWVRTSACDAIELEHRWRKNNSFASMHTFSERVCVSVWVSVLGVKSIFQIALLPSQTWNACTYYLSFGRRFFISIFLAPLLIRCVSVCLVIMSYKFICTFPKYHTHYSLYERTHKMWTVWIVSIDMEILYRHAERERKKLIKKWHQYDTYRWMIEQTTHSIFFKYFSDAMIVPVFVCDVDSNRILYRKLVLLQQHTTSEISWKCSTCNAHTNASQNYTHRRRMWMFSFIWSIISLIMTAFHIITYTFVIFMVFDLGFVYLFLLSYLHFNASFIHPAVECSIQYGTHVHAITLRRW